jgi:hypothetical protein
MSIKFALAEGWHGLKKSEQGLLSFFARFRLMKPVAASPFVRDVLVQVIAGILLLLTIAVGQHLFGAAR